MRPIALKRTARRLGLTTLISTLNSINSSISSKPHHKHIKIDDEERQLSHPNHTNHHPTHPMLRLLFILLLLIPLILLIVAYTIYKPPHWLISLLSAHNASVLFHVPLPASQRVVALTIDDAPSPYTATILDHLKKHNAHATFFIIGSQVAAFPEIIQRIHDEGHELGNHAWRDEPSISLPLPVLHQQITDVENLLLPNEGGRKWFRPGSGWFNARMVREVEGMGYKVALGSIWPWDVLVQRPGWGARFVCSMLRGGGVVVVHDRREWSGEQVRLVLEGMGGRGWRGVSLGGLVGLVEREGKGR